MKKLEILYISKSRYLSLHFLNGWKNCFLQLGYKFKYIQCDQVDQINEYLDENDVDYIFTYSNEGLRNLNYKKLEQINLHKPIISEYSSIIAKNNEIRKILKKFQITFSKKNIKCCIEGRDISTKILPNSDLKFYFKCNLTVAANRRFKELKKLDPNIKLKDVKKALKIRNILDTNRKHSPLLKHRNSVEIDTGKLNKQAMLRKMSTNVDKILTKKYGN